MSESSVPPGSRAFEPLSQSGSPRPRLSCDGLTLLVGTKKGVFFLSASAARERFDLSGPVFLGHIVHHAVARSARSPHAAAWRCAPDTLGRR